MKFQKILEFGQISLELKGQFRLSLDKAVLDIKTGLKEILLSDYKLSDGERFIIRGRDEMDSSELMKIRKEAYASMLYDEEYMIEDGKEITMSENMIHSFYGKNGFFIGLNQMKSESGDLVYLDATCNTTIELRLIEEVCNKHFSSMGTDQVVELVKDNILSHHIYLFIISLESCSHTSLNKGIIDLYSRALKSDKVSIVESALYCIGFDESPNNVYAKHFYPDILRMKEVNQVKQLNSAFESVIKEIESKK